MSRIFTAHELGKGDNYVVFALVEGKVHISEWYGYDIKRVDVVSECMARTRWTSLRTKGYEVINKDMKVTAIYVGLDRGHVPAALVAACYEECRIR